MLLSVMMMMIGLVSAILVHPLASVNVDITSKGRNRMIGNEGQTTKQASMWRHLALRQTPHPLPQRTSPRSSNHRPNSLTVCSLQMTSYTPTDPRHVFPREHNSGCGATCNISWPAS
ncbi:hypothetical protein IWX49DRAFT_584156 [Phyllosticta citricarpa]|uniref:Secreted protein n=1 Tax=Phyllosticta paracitricarpa TaxID=2016321 RepID=A0ABR1MTY7_9PEZI